MMVSRVGGRPSRVGQGRGTRRRAALACALFGLASAPAVSLARASPEGAPEAPCEEAAPSVRLAEVASNIDRENAPIDGVTDLLRADVERALAEIDWRKAGLRKSYLVSVSVVRLSSESAEQRVRVSCTVSVSLREAERGAVLAVLEGRARGEDTPSKGTDLAREALATAARGAVSRIAEAIRRVD